MKSFETAIVCLLCWIVSWPLHAQDSKPADADSLFSMARKEVFEGNRAKGQEKLKYILQENRGYDEVRIFLARTYSWDGSFEEARKELQTILKTNAGNQDAVDALIDVEMWSAHYDEAVKAAESGLTTHPDNEHFLYKHASALNSLDRHKEALLSLTKLLQINPAHEKGIALYDDINVRSLKYTAGITYGTDFFNRAFDPAHYVSVQLSRKNSWGASDFRLNYAQRFDTHGTQFEIDFYPTIANGIYAYLNYGYSQSGLFPENRVGAELFFKLPKGVESSAGIRYMDFDHDTKIVIYTGSVGCYLKNYWLSIRPYLAPNPKTGTSASATIFLRRYFNDGENYLGLNAGFGFSPDLGRIQNGAGFSENDIHLLKSQGAGLAWQKVFKSTWTINLSVGRARQALAFTDSHDVIITSCQASIRKKI